jgi:hypothetical protein
VDAKHGHPDVKVDARRDHEHDETAELLTSAGLIGHLPFFAAFLAALSQSSAVGGFFTVVFGSTATGSTTTAGFEITASAVVFGYAATGSATTAGEIGAGGTPIVFSGAGAIGGVATPFGPSTWGSLTRIGGAGLGVAGEITAPRAGATSMGRR